MTFGSYAFGSSATGGLVSTGCVCPSCNLVVMELLEQSPGYLDLDKISRHINNII